MLGLDAERWLASAAPLDRQLVTSEQMQRGQHERVGMLMFRDETTLTSGRALMRPVFDALFRAAVDDEFGMYCVNHYETGDAFRPHQDYFDGTVVIATISGEREFDVYRREDEDDVFLEVEATCTLTPGSILLLDGYSNRGHAARCLRGPSVSVVADIASRPDFG
ncbi:hypothetical protein DSM112329_00197 [Paraconexibacter sp. AEG42_29]|uniref:Fe2OG dioxygenase domain-containing protein n=2 Tax=Paraconexibacter sp. AEG42_29 TaxID=2997339 RepID=A0AAU7APF7_9ACTN